MPRELPLVGTLQNSAPLDFGCDVRDDLCLANAVLSAEDSTGVDGARVRERLAVLVETRGWPELSRLTAVEWSVALGVEQARAERLVAAFELGRRVERSGETQRGSLRSAREVFELVQPELRGRLQETFVVLLLDGRHRLRRLAMVTTGTLTSSLVHPREVFAPALSERAAAIVVAHNHPTGDPEPSSEDLEVTRRLRSAGKLLGVPLIDHVVVGQGRYCSLREREGW